MRVRPLQKLSLLAAALILGSAVPAAPVQEADAVATAQAKLVERDARLSFRLESSRRARAALEEGALTPPERAAALIALGCGRSRADLPRIESSVVAGGAFERQAAILALGEMGSAGVVGLEHVLDAEVAGLEQALALGLARAARGGDARAAELLERAARSPAGALSAAAQELLDYAAGGAPPIGRPVVRALHDLRWDAARSYGYVDGRLWRNVVVDELLEDEGFLDRFVLEAAAREDSLSVRDHLRELLLGRGGVGVVRAAVRAMPVELNSIVREDRWQPTELEEWQALLEGIEEGRLEASTVDILRAAFEDERLRGAAGVLLLRAGVELDWTWFREALREGPVPLRLKLIVACGDRGDPTRIRDLLGLVHTRYDGPVEAAALVALERLGYPQSHTDRERILSSETSPEVEGVLLAMAAVAYDRNVERRLEIEARRPDLSPAARFEIELALAEHGRSPDRALLRYWLEHAGRAPGRIAVVRTLAKNADGEDLALLGSLFPVIEDPELDAELAHALLRYRDPVALRLLRSAMWDRRSWNRSVLAARLLAQSVGIYSVLDELSSPPPGAGVEDLRRMGFAVGEWGGLPAVELLARRRNEGDPALQGAFLGALSTRTH